MITAFRRIEGVGRYDAARPGKTPFTAFTLVYGENGRGKTTLATILSSLARDDPSLILERRRLGAERPPRIEIEIDGDVHLFDEDRWRDPCPLLSVFDDNFVAENVCSGLEVDTAHCRNLHELIIGAEGVRLNQALQRAIAEIEERNRALKKLEAQIPAHLRGGAPVEAFCAIPPVRGVDKAIAKAERQYAAAEAAAQVQDGPLFEPFRLTPIDAAALEATLARGLPDLEAEAAAHVQRHVAALGEGGEAWISDGVARAVRLGRDPETGENPCPFCAQDLGRSGVIAHYQVYFSEAYAALKTEIAAAEARLEESCGSEPPAAVERALGKALKAINFWERFTELPEIEFDSDPIVDAIEAAWEEISRLLAAKAAAPLEPVAIDAAARAALDLYAEAVTEMTALAATFEEANAELAEIQADAAADDAEEIARRLAELMRAKLRHDPPLAEPCDAYLETLAQKKRFEAARKEAREALDHYQQAVFPRYERSINAFLKRFNASYTLGEVGSRNTRSGSSCNYKVLINKTAVPLSKADGPSFKNTLSAGDRNTLALAFFFAALEHDPERARRIVVIDDPMTSLDEHRTLATRQEIRKLADGVAQVIVLSHDKTFLYGLWEAARRETRSGVLVKRVREASTLAPWDVTRDAVTEHDKRHALIRDYIDGRGAEGRAVAGALRPMLETFLRAAYPLDFPPGTMIGQFLKTCRKQARAERPLLSAEDMEELRNILDYANSFHHDTNRACDRESINDMELYDFVLRTVNFTRRGGG